MDSHAELEPETKLDSQITSQMLSMVEKTFGDSKWKTAQADGKFMNGLMSIMNSLQNEGDIPQQFKHQSQVKVKMVMLWARIYELATNEYKQALKDLKESKQIQTDLQNEINKRNAAQKDIAAQMFNNYLQSMQTKKKQDSTITAAGVSF